jgi:PAS domain S-box-containing protein
MELVGPLQTIAAEPETSAASSLPEPMQVTGPTLDDELQTAHRSPDDAPAVTAPKAAPAADSEAAELNYRSFFEHAIDGLFRTTPEGRYLNANPALARMYGYDSPAELIAALTDIGEQLYVDPQQRREFLRRMEEEGTVSDFEAQIYRRDETVIWISENARVVRDAAGKPIFYEGTVRDITARREMEDALGETETTWRCLVENSGDLIFLVDESGNLLFSNRIETPEDSEKPPASIYGYLSEETSNALREVIARIFENATIQNFELEAVAGDQTQWYESRAIPIEVNGEVTSVLIIGAEITDQKKTESDLRASQRFIQRVADSSPNILYVYDLSERRYVYCNHQLFKILGYTFEELFETGSQFLELTTHPDDLSLLDARGKKLAQARDGEVFESEFRVRHHDEGWRWIRARDTVFTRTADGQPLEIIGIAEDITERRRVNLAFRESEARYRRIVEGVSIVPWERTTPSRFSFVGPQAAGLLGYPVEKWYDEHFWLDHVHPADRDRVRGLWDGPEQRTYDFEVEYRMKAAGGRITWVRDIVHVFKGDGGRTMWQGFMLDITERKESREKLKQSREQLRALSAKLQSAREHERTSNAREIHDELGGALTAMKMDLTLVRRRLEPLSEEWVAGKFDSIAALIDSATDAMRRIATNLRPPVLDSFGLVAAIEWQATDFEKRYGIRCEVQSQWKTIVQDEALSTAMFRIFQESLTNVARHAHASRVQVCMKEETGKLVLIVSDNGRGITEGELTRSLGLLGMRERAMLFGGSVEIEGSPDRGTKVTVSIPVEEVSEKSAKREQS